MEEGSDKGNRADERADADSAPSLLTPALLQRAAAAGGPAAVWDVLTDAGEGWACGIGGALQRARVLALSLSPSFIPLSSHPPPTGAAPTTEAEGTALLAAALEAGHLDLAKAAYGAMAAAGAAPTPSARASWPRGGPAAATALILGLARALRPGEAEAVLDVVRARGEGGLPVALTGGGSAPSPSTSASSSSAVGFGVVVSSPGAPGVPLTVVQPQEGRKLVACAACRYEFEAWSGTVVRAASTPLEGGGAAGGALARAVAALARAAAAAAGRPPPPAAAHELDVLAPPGGSGGGRIRPFRFATAGGAAPAGLGERVTVVCSPLEGGDGGEGGEPPPSSPSPATALPDALLDLAAFGAGIGGDPSPTAPYTRSRRDRRRGLLAPSLPGTVPGQPLLIANHGAGREVAALPAPPPGAGAPVSNALVPAWAGPLVLSLLAAVVLAGVADPALPAALAVGAAAATAGTAAASAWALPALRRLPASSVEVEASRQALLSQHVRLTARMTALRAAAAADVGSLARLTALRGKMGSVGAAYEEGADEAAGGVDNDSNTLSEYATRSARLAAAAGVLEGRVGAAVRLLAGYARLAGRVEIEVELEAGVPDGEAGALGAAGEALDVELAELGAEWRGRAAAADEVERLLSGG